MEKKSAAWWLRAFLTGCVLGWLAEVALCFFREGVFANRGFLRGPWMPLYGFGVLVFVFLSRAWRFKPRYPAIFVLGVFLTGILEYVTAALLENGFALRWWNYGNAFLSIGGRVWFPALVGFSLGGTLIARGIASWPDPRIGKGRFVAPIMLACIIADACYSIINPNSGRFIASPMQ